MYRNLTEEAEFRRIGSELGIDSTDVKRVVNSFFSVILEDVRKLPFDNHRKIYSKEKFDSYCTVRNIPSIGRIGPVYSRYLKWRANESAGYEMRPRSSYRSRMLQGEIEDIAAAILSGKTPSLTKKKKGSELYDRIWLVGENGKKSARQVIPKTNK